MKSIKELIPNWPNTDKIHIEHEGPVTNTHSYRIGCRDAIMTCEHVVEDYLKRSRPMIPTKIIRAHDLKRGMIMWYEDEARFRVVVSVNKKLTGTGEVYRVGFYGGEKQEYHPRRKVIVYNREIV